MLDCGKCAKFPFCNEEPKENCNKFVKRNYDVKLTKVNGLNFEFERIK